MEPCTRCRATTPHRVLDDTGSTPTCPLCLIALVGDLDQHITVTVVVHTTRVEEPQ